MKTSLKFLLAGCFALAACTSAPLVSSLPNADQTIDNPNVNHASSILAWNAYVGKYYYKAYAPQGAHQLAELTTAVHDALNTISFRYNFFVGDVSSAPSVVSAIPSKRNQRINNASPDAAIAGVYQTLLPLLYADLQLYNTIVPKSVFTADDLAFLQDDLNAFVTSRLAAAQAANRRLTQQQIDDGLAIGAAAALQVHASREADGHNRYEFYLPNPPPTYWGVWKPISNTQMAYAQYSDIEPFAIDAITNYFAPPPPQLNDTTFLNDLLEIKSVGTDGLGAAHVPTSTTPDQLNLAKWMAGLGADQMTSYWLQFLLARDYPRVATDLWASARLFALVQVATMDANVVNQYNKRIYNFWRPRDALIVKWNVNVPQGSLPVPCPSPDAGLPCLGSQSQGSISVGASCSLVQCWTPNVAYTPLGLGEFSGMGPNTPEYPAGLPTQVSAAAAIVSYALQLGPDQKFPGGPLVLQYSDAIPAFNFSTMNQFTQASIDGSVYAGNHFRNSGNVGAQQGKQVAAEVYANVLQRPGYGRKRSIFSWDFGRFFGW